MTCRRGLRAADGRSTTRPVVLLLLTDRPISCILRHRIRLRRCLEVLGKRGLTACFEIKVDGCLLGGCRQPLGFGILHPVRSGNSIVAPENCPDRTTMADIAAVACVIFHSTIKFDRYTCVANAFTRASARFGPQNKAPQRWHSELYFTKEGNLVISSSKLLP